MGQGDLPDRVTFSSERLSHLLPSRSFPRKAGGQAELEDLLGTDVPQEGLAASTGLPRPQSPICPGGPGPPWSSPPFWNLAPQAILPLHCLYHDRASRPLGPCLSGRTVDLPPACSPDQQAEGHCKGGLLRAAGTETLGARPHHLGVVLG